MLIIGLAGGIASGKSYVAEQFCSLGAMLLDADKLGHEVLQDGNVIDQVSSAFGPEVINDQQQLNRGAIAKLVFGTDSRSQNNLTILEQIVHPRISERIRQRIDEFRRQEVPAVILDAAVMFKSGWDQFCDKIVFIEADRKTRLERASLRGWSEEHFAFREASQTPLEIKRQRATDVIDNNIGSDHTNQQVIQLWQQWNLPRPDNHEVPTNA